MPDGGTITLQISTVESPAGDKRAPAGEAGRYGQLIVSDEGTGIPADVRDRIFDPFFSTKARGHDTTVRLRDRLQHRGTEWREPVRHKQRRHRHVLRDAAAAATRRRRRSRR
ncbi:MAG: hypothetical protein U5K74_13175 [Gemmatimonadaceae bacterium]|nr:hypothetical protein [Gemmatimonadaceae bacterium]